MRDVEQFIRMALECSIFLSPRDPGLVHAEILEAASRAGFKEGETRDSIGAVVRRVTLGRTQPRLQLPKDDVPIDFGLDVLRPDFRNAKAFDFLVAHLRELARSMTRAKAKASRDTLVAHAVAQGIPERDTEAAITIWLIGEYLEEKDGLIYFQGGQAPDYLPSQQLAENDHGYAVVREGMERVFEIVKDVIARRTDDRSPVAEPIKAFEAALEGLGHARFRMWWAQAAGEFRLADPATSPMSVCVLGAALAEGALTFVVARARKLGLATMNSKTFAESSTRWKFEDLLSSAAAGGADAIFDQRTRDRADRLNVIRQRIHVGRLMAEQPTGPVPDTRPEEARDAKETLDAVLRRVLDWLAAHPDHPS